MVLQLETTDPSRLDDIPEIWLSRETGYPDYLIGFRGDVI